MPSTTSAAWSTVPAADALGLGSYDDFFPQEDSPLTVYSSIDGNITKDFEALASSSVSVGRSSHGSIIDPSITAVTTEALDPLLFLDGLDWSDCNLESPLSGDSIPFILTPPLGDYAAMTEDLPATAETDSAVKRRKGPSDKASACWTSPLCPNSGKEGSIPNPSTCSGGCAPFLFNFKDPLIPDPTSQDTRKVEIAPTGNSHGVKCKQPRSLLKRSESETGCDYPRLPSSQSVAKPRPQQQREVPSGSTQEKSPQLTEEAKSNSRQRVPHNQVERKYRETLNTQLESLRRVAPSLRSSPETCDKQDIEDLPAPTKPSKAVVLASATSYIKQLEKDNKQLANENEILHARIKALQDLVKCEDCSLMQYVVNLKINGSRQLNGYIWTLIYFDALWKPENVYPARRSPNMEISTCRSQKALACDAAPHVVSRSVSTENESDADGSEGCKR